MASSQSRFQNLQRSASVPADSKVSDRRAEFRAVLDLLEHTMVDVLDRLASQADKGPILREVIASRVTWARASVLDVALLTDDTVLADFHSFADGLIEDVASAVGDHDKYEAIDLAVEDVHSFLLARGLVGHAYRAIQSGMPVGELFAGGKKGHPSHTWSAAGRSPESGRTLDAADSHEYALAA